jgi:hypothetical protein
VKMVGVMIFRKKAVTEGISTTPTTNRFQISEMEWITNWKAAEMGGFELKKVGSSPAIAIVYKAQRIM